MLRKEADSMKLSMFELLSVCTLLFFAADYGVSEQFGGAYNFIVQTLEPCPDAHRYRLRFSSRLSKYNRTTVTYSSIINMPYGFDDTWTAYINVAVWGNGGYRENFYNVKFDDFCSTLTSYWPDETAKLAKNIKVDQLCPLKEGKYDIKDYIVKFGPLFGIPEIPYGKYKFEVITEKKHKNKTKELMGCFRSNVEISQKRV